MFNVNGKGDAAETSDPMIVVGIAIMADEAINQARKMVEDAVDGWDGSFNADDIRHLTMALETQARATFAMASQTLDGMGRAAGYDPDQDMEILRAAKSVMQDCAILIAKLEAALQRHPHTISVTPF